MRSVDCRRNCKRGPLPTPQRTVFCEVMVESDNYGACEGTISNITSTGAFIEIVDPLPLGTLVRICFQADDVAIVVHAVVQQHHTLTFFDPDGQPNAISGMVVRFVSFEAGERQLSLQLH